MCSFEQDHRLCRYKVFDNYSDDGSCEPVYTWKRRGGINDLHGIADHTLDDVTGIVDSICLTKCFDCRFTYSQILLKISIDFVSLIHWSWLGYK